MKRSFSICVLLFMLALPAEAAFERMGFTPLSQGAAGNTAFPLWIPWSSLDNPASLAGIQSAWLLSEVSPSPFGLAELSTARIGAALPTSFGSISLTTFTSGFSLYRELSFDAGWGLRMGEGIDVGLRTTLFSLTIAGYGSALAVGIDAGACWRPLPSICLGWFAARLNSPALERFHDRLPMSLNFGCSLSPLPWSEISLDVRQEAETSTEFRFGCTLQPHQALHLHVQIRNNPAEITWGADLLVLSLLVSYRLSTHPALGMTHTIGLGFKLGA
jgi:hypothetical protein